MRKVVVLTDNAFKVIFNTLVQKYMKKVKMINVNESVIMGLSTSSAMEYESKSPIRLCIRSDLYYFNPKIHEKSENHQFQ